MNLALTRSPLVSFVISTRNRRDVLLQTLAQIALCGLENDAFETLVVDNASTDGTADAVEKQFPDICLLRLRHNGGAVARNVGIAAAIGRYIVLLDDDSYPAPGAIERMIGHFDADPKLGCANFTVTLPNGSQECSAYPKVFIGCGAGFRSKAIAQAGGLPDDYFMMAEEYDLSLRMLDVGWEIHTFDDLHVTHLKTAKARQPARTMRLDARNNLVLAMRRFPAEHALAYACDWMGRYRKIARANGRRLAFWMGFGQGILRSMQFWKRHPVSLETFETFSEMNGVHQRMSQLQQSYTLHRVLFADLGKNMLPCHRAAKRLGIEIVGIADNRLAGIGHYRGIPIITDEAADALAFDAVIISNSSPVHARQRASQWRARCRKPVFELFDATAEISGSYHPAGSEFHQTAARSA